MTPYFGTGASRFIYFVCMCWAILLGYRVMKENVGAGVERLARNDSEAQWDRASCVWSSDSPFHAAFKLYFSLFLPKDNFRYSIFIPRSDGKAELGKITGIASRPSSRKRHILPLRISGKLWKLSKHALQLKKYFFFFTCAYCNFSVLEGNHRDDLKF